MDKKDFIERSLVKLKRKYGKDELVMSLIKRIKQIELENGILKSEVDELNYKLEEISSFSQEQKYALFHDKWINQLNNSINSLKGRIKSLEQKNNILVKMLNEKNK